MTWLGEEGLLPRVRWIARGLRSGAPRGAAARDVAVIGHRGAARLAPENTRAAFARAVGLGADGMEVDVCVTSDGTHVLWHDADPNDGVALVRQAGREGFLYAPCVPAPGSPERRPVAEIPFEAFRRDHFYRLAGTPPPGEPEPPPRAPFETLSDLLDWAQAEPRLRRLYLDVKFPVEQAGRVPGLVAELARRAASGGIPSRLALRTISPHREVYERLREGLREIRGADIEAAADFELPNARLCARRIGAPRIGIGLGRRFWPGFRAEAEDAVSAREAGELEEALLWTINGRERLEQLTRIGPDAVVTDEPDLLREALDRLAAPVPGKVGALAARQRHRV